MYAGHGIGSALLAYASRSLLELGYTELISSFLLGNNFSMLWHWRNGFDLLPYVGSMRNLKSRRKKSSATDGETAVSPAQRAATFSAIFGTPPMARKHGLSPWAESGQTDAIELARDVLVVSLANPSPAYAMAETWDISHTIGHGSKQGLNEASPPATGTPPMSTEFYLAPEFNDPIPKPGSRRQFKLHRAHGSRGHHCDFDRTFPAGGSQLRGGCASGTVREQSQTNCPGPA